MNAENESSTVYIISLSVYLSTDIEVPEILHYGKLSF